MCNQSHPKVRPEYSHSNLSFPFASISPFSRMLIVVDQSKNQKRNQTLSVTGNPSYCKICSSSRKIFSTWEVREICQFSKVKPQALSIYFCLVPRSCPRPRRSRCSPRFPLLPSSWFSPRRVSTCQESSQPSRQLRDLPSLSFSSRHRGPAGRAPVRAEVVRPQEAPLAVRLRLRDGHRRRVLAGDLGLPADDRAPPRGWPLPGQADGSARRKQGEHQNGVWLYLFLCLLFKHFRLKASLRLWTMLIEI